MSSAVPSQPPTDLHALDTMFAELGELEPARDPVLEWMASHREDLAPYLGHRVAIDPARGLLAVGPTLADVHRKLAAAGLMDDEDITIATVM